MTSRDELVERVQHEIATTGLAKDTSKIFKVLLLNNILRMLLLGRPKYDMIKYLNTVRCGKDLVPIVQEVYDLIKDVEL